MQAVWARDSRKRQVLDLIAIPTPIAWRDTSLHPSSSSTCCPLVHMSTHGAELTVAGKAQSAHRAFRWPLMTLAALRFRQGRRLVPRRWIFAPETISQYDGEVALDTAATHGHTPVAMLRLSLHCQATRRLKLPWLRGLAALAAVSLMAGCNHHSTSAPGPGPDAGCTQSFPDRLGVTTQVQEEVEYLDEVAACAAPFTAQTYLRNESPVVWTITTTNGDSVKQQTASLRLDSFRALAKSVYPYAILAPGSDVVVEASPVNVEWNLAPGLSAMWLAHDTLADQVEKFGEDQLINMLSDHSPRRQALITCSLTAYRAAGEAGTLLTSSQPGEELLGDLGIFSPVLTSCARAWQLADEDVLERFPRTATWTDDIIRLSEDVDFVARANAELTELRTLGKIALNLSR